MVRVYLCLIICLVCGVELTSGSAESECLRARTQVLASYDLIAERWSTEDGSQFPTAVKEMGVLLANLKTTLVSCPALLIALKLDSPQSCSPETYSLESLDLTVLDQAKATLDALNVEQTGSQVLLQGADISPQITDNPLPKLTQEKTQLCYSACQEELYEMFKTATNLVMDVAMLPNDVVEDLVWLVTDGYFTIRDCSGYLF